MTNPVHEPFLNGIPLAFSLAVNEYTVPLLGDNWSFHQLPQPCSVRCDGRPCFRTGAGPKTRTMAVEHLGPGVGGPSICVVPATLTRSELEIVSRVGPVYITALSESQKYRFRRTITCCRSVRRVLNGLDCCTRCKSFNTLSTQWCCQ
jgi:hypothetical protein